MTNTTRPANKVVESVDAAIASVQENGEAVSFEFASEMITLEKVEHGASPYFKASCGETVAAGDTPDMALNDLITLRW